MKISFSFGLCESLVRKFASKDVLIYDHQSYRQNPSTYVLQTPFGPWSPSNGPSIFLCPQLVYISLIFLGSVMHPSGQCPPILCLVFIQICPHLNITISFYKNVVIVESLTLILPRCCRPSASNIMGGALHHKL